MTKPNGRAATATRSAAAHFLTEMYTYSVEQIDGDFVAKCAEFPSLSWVAGNEASAMRGIKDVVHGALIDMLDNDEEPPICMEARPLNPWPAEK